jgi:hypothetical protein
VANGGIGTGPAATLRPLLRVVGWVVAIPGALVLGLSILLLIAGVLAYQQSDVYSTWGPAIAIILGAIGALASAALTATGCS